MLLFCRIVVTTIIIVGRSLDFASYAHTLQNGIVNPCKSDRISVIEDIGKFQIAQSV
jgi:hypothetical protein